MKNKIAIFTNGFSNEFIEAVLEGIRAEAKKDSTDLFVFVSYTAHGDMMIQNKCQMNIFHHPNPKDFDGAIMFTNTFNFDFEKDRICAIFQRAEIPMVSLEVKVPGMAFLSTGNYNAVCSMTEHLLTVHNVKKVVYVSGIPGNQESEVRKQAISDTLAKHNLELVDDIPSAYAFFEAMTNVTEWIKKGNELPDAFMCANDQEALGVMSALDALGIKVPEQVKVTGFDRIASGVYTFPMLASVKRNWDILGHKAFIKLKEQMVHPDTEVEEIYEGEYVPSESCGCVACEEERTKRLDKIKNSFFKGIFADRSSLMFQKFRLAVAKTASKEEFHQHMREVYDDDLLLPHNFWLCTEPGFFELEDEEYVQRVRGYSKKLDVIYCRENEESLPLFQFDSKTLVPHYRKEAGVSNTYIFVPLNHMEYIIGYIVFKNQTEDLYSQYMFQLVRDFNSVFYNVRQYVFAQRTARKLEEIYMTDQLTGVYNRTGCQNVLYKYIQQRKLQEKSSMLLFIDIDAMKHINDNYGHLNGDLAIKATADAMKTRLPEGWLLGRYGGDEFIAVGESLSDDYIVAWHMNLVDRIKEYIESLNLSFKLSVSIGYVIIDPNDELTIDEYISAADESMYAQKEIAHERIAREGL